MPRQLYKKLIVFKRTILADHPSGGKKNRRLRKKNKEGWELYLGEKEGKRGEVWTRSCRGSRTIDRGHFGRLFPSVASKLLLCGILLHRVQHTCFCECTHCRAASSQLWRLHARFDSDIIALDPVTCDSMVIACMVMPRVLSVDTRISERFLSELVPWVPCDRLVVTIRSNTKFHCSILRLLHGLRSLMEACK